MTGGAAIHGSPQSELGYRIVLRLPQFNELETGTSISTMYETEYSPHPAARSAKVACNNVAPSPRQVRTSLPSYKQPGSVRYLQRLPSRPSQRTMKGTLRILPQHPQSAWKKVQLSTHRSIIRKQIPRLGMPIRSGAAANASHAVVDFKRPLAVRAMRESVTLSQTLPLPTMANSRPLGQQ